MSSPGHTPRPSQRRRVRRAGKARVYRRRRLFALIAAVVLLAVLGGVLWAAVGGSGADTPPASGSGSGSASASAVRARREER